MTGEALHVGLAVESSGPITALGRSVDADEAQVWMPGREMDLIMAGPDLSLDIGVDAWLVEELGWQVRGEPLKKVSVGRLRKLIRVCHRASTEFALNATNKAIAPTSPKTELWRDIVLDHLEPVLQPWLADSETDEESPFPGTRHFRLVKRVEEFVNKLDDDQPIDVDGIAESLGVSRRTIFYAYRRVLDIGPYRYFELKRLHTLRTRLKRASKPESTIASIATELGFGDLGRLAARYRRQFGENPSQTLKWG